MIFIGIGSNLPSSFGDRFKNIDLSISFLEEIGVKLIQKSSFYETLSQPNKNDPKFINVVISVSSILSPIDLMLSLISIEEKLGRKRMIKNAPRTCDLDIIDFIKNCHNFISKNITVKNPNSCVPGGGFAPLGAEGFTPLGPGRGLHL